MSEVKRLLSQTRLLTLTGSGGAGKTRLALRAAAETARSFPDGVWLVPLAAIDDPQLVVQAVFSALGLQDVSSGLSLSTLSRYLADKHLLLVLDNCEHLLDSYALLAVTLLKACPELRVLATSRQALGTTGETRLRVPQMSLPEGAVKDIFHQDFVNHEAGPRTPAGPEGLKMTVAWLRSSFSDLDYDIKDEIVEGDKIVVRLISSGRHTGEFIGFPPTDRGSLSSRFTSTASPMARSLNIGRVATI